MGSRDIRGWVYYERFQGMYDRALRERSLGSGRAPDALFAGVRSVVAAALMILWATVLDHHLRLWW